MVVHALAGLALGSLLRVPLWAVVVCALVGHVLMDLVPHWDYVHSQHRVRWALFDIGAAGIALGAAGLHLGWTSAAFVCGLFSAAPDFELADVLVPYGGRLRLFPSHWRRFPHGACGKAPGIAVQAAIAALSVVIIAVAEIG